MATLVIFSSLKLIWRTISRPHNCAKGGPGRGAGHTRPVNKERWVVSQDVGATGIRSHFGGSTSCARGGESGGLNRSRRLRILDLKQHQNNEFDEPESRIIF